MQTLITYIQATLSLGTAGALIVGLPLLIGEYHPIFLIINLFG